MNKVLLIARWEFITTVTRRAYIFAVVAMPLFYGGMVALAGFAGRSATTNASRVPTALVDRAHVLDLAAARAQAERRDRADTGDPLAAFVRAAPETPLVEYGDLDAALEALRARTVATVFALDADYVTTGGISVYTRDAGFLSQQAERQRQGQVADAIRVGLVRAVLAGDQLARAYAPLAGIRHLRLNAAGAPEPVTDPAGLGPFAGSLGPILILTMSIFFSAGFLVQATIEDRQSRMIEILFSSVDPHELVLGKILGLGGAGLLQVAIYVALIIVPGATLLAIFHISVAKLALSLVYCAIAYAMFACLIMWTGMIGRTSQESAQMSALWMLAAASPMFFIASIGAAPNGWIARALSFVPLTSPVTMMLRIASADVPSADIVVSMVIGGAAIYLALRGAARIFRAAALMYGKRPTLPEVVRWLRVA
jgi:ABC-2 type transport system permease protein